MNRWCVRLVLIAFCVLAFPCTSPAPLVYRPGEGWVYEPVGGGKWVRTRARDQLEVAQTAFDSKAMATFFQRLEINFVRLNRKTVPPAVE